MGPTITMRPDEEKPVWRLANSKRPSHRICPGNGQADRTPRGSLLACMTASREQSNQGLELTGRRRFALRAVASCSHTELRSDLSVDVLPKQLHDQLLLCFRLG